MKRSWTEIDLDIIRNNYYIYQSHIGTSKRIMAVVKADAYGHGDIEVAHTLQECGVKDFAVSNIQEAVRLRKHNIEGQILILGYTPLSECNQLLEYDITQAIVCEEYADSLIPGIKVQFAIDTGMNRIGLDAEDARRCSDIIHFYSNKFILTGIFTHLCIADQKTIEAIKFTQKQIDLFQNIFEKVKDLDLDYVHCLNSAGGIFYNAEFTNLVRLGIVMYGLKPDYSNNNLLGIKPAMSWKSSISMVKIVHAGETIGYGCTYMAMKDMTVATVSTGYADGYSRLLSNKGIVLIDGKKAPIVGRVCMDQLMIDVTDVENVFVGREVVLLGESNDISFNADDMAQIVGTIGYEIVCNISKRVERVYI